jgi:YggT family protein
VSILITVITVIFRGYELLMLIRVLLSWVNVNPYHPLVRLLHRVTDPVLKPVRRIIPPIGGTVDISPVVVLIVIDLLYRLLISLLMRP